MVGYADADMTIRARTSRADAESWHASLYGAAQLGPVAMRAGGAYSWHALYAERSVAFTGFADALASAYDARTAQVFGEMAYPVAFSSGALEPFADLAWAKLDADSFTEAGGAAALAVEKAEEDRTWSTLGLRGQLHEGGGEGLTFFTASAGWMHGFGVDTLLRKHSFAGGGSFDVATAPLARDSAVLEAGLNLTLNGICLRMGYSGRLASGSADHSARASLIVRFN